METGIYVSRAVLPAVCTYLTEGSLTQSDCGFRAAETWGTSVLGKDLMRLGLGLSPSPSHSLLLFFFSLSSSLTLGFSDLATFQSRHSLTVFSRVTQCSDWPRHRPVPAFLWGTISSTEPHTWRGVPPGNSCCLSRGENTQVALLPCYRIRFGAACRPESSKN